MPTVVDRLEQRKQLTECKVCLWLASLDEKAQREWSLALGNPRYGHTMVAAEMAVDGGDVSNDAVARHRTRAHK